MQTFGSAGIIEIPYSIEYIMARGLDNNNPGNIVKGGKPFLGEIVPSRDKRFRQFESRVYGYRALLLLLRNYKRLYGCSNIAMMIERWAPPSENNTKSYINFVCEKTGLHRYQYIDTYDKDVMIKLAAAISQMENGEKPVMSEIEAGWIML